MAGRGQATFEIRTPEQFEAIASPVRRQIVFTLAESGAMSVAELAERTGRTVTSLYRHVKILVGVGLLTEAGTRGEGREREALYAVPAKRLTFAKGPLPRASREAIARGIAGDLRRASRLVTEALVSGRGTPTGPDRDAWAGTAMCWLTPEELRKVNEHLRALDRLITDTPERPGTRPIGVVHVVYPQDGAGA